MQTWVEKTLLPFFFYFNCSATNRQVISLFFDESSIARKLLPAYLALGFYKHSIKHVLDRLNYQTQFPPFTIKVVHKGSVSFVESIDYLNRVICIKNGMGGVTYLNFDDAYQLRWTYSGSKHIEKQLNSFIDLKKSENDDFFNFPIDPAKSEFEGVLFFTRKRAFIESLKGICINGAPITSGIHIQEVIYNREEDRYEFRSTSSKKAITRKPVAIAVAAQEDIYAFENILNSAGKSLAHIHTIVVDDFDDRVQRAEKDAGAFSDLKARINEDVLSHFRNGRARNVFFVNRSHNYSSVQTFWKMKGNDLIPCEWLLTPSSVVDMNSVENPMVNMRLVNCFHLEQLLLEVERICQEWRSLVAQYFCNGETLKGLVKIHALKRTLNGIYDPKKVKLELSVFKTFLDGLTATYFANSSDNGLIKRTQNFIAKIVALDENQLNHKLHDLAARIIDVRSDRIIAIVNSFKPSQDDIEYVTNHLNKIRPGLKLMLFGSKDELPCTRNAFALHWFILTFSEKWKKVPFFTIIGSETEYLLSKTEFRHAQSHANYIMDTLDSIDKQALVSRCLRMELLIPKKQGIIFTIDSSSASPNTVVEVDQGEDVPFERILKSLDQSWKMGDRISEDEAKVCVLTDDGTVYTWGESRKIFIYQDGARSIDESFRYAKELREGDKLILLKQDYKQNTNIKKTIEEILGSTTEYAATLTNYNEWRWLIEGRIEAMSNDWSRFCSALKTAGFDTTHQTISHWVDGTTTYPHNFKRLLVALADMGIIERNNAGKYLQAVKTVKSLQITFIREALKKLLSDIEGIEYSSENVAINERVINSFIDKIEVKRVENILIESYAN